MIFTIYYMTATIFQSWRLKTICSKLSKQLSTNASVVFYNVEETDVTATPISSELCSNQQEAQIQECLWYNKGQRGCSIIPHQNIFLGPWIAFPAAPSLIPVNFSKGTNTLIDHMNEIYLLIETGTMPQTKDTDDILLMEHYGMPIAWKVDSRIAILLKSDLKHFSELIVSSFLHDRFLLNDKLPIIRIQSVSIDGEPQPYDLVKNHTKKDNLNRIYHKLNKVQWERHFEQLKQLSVLANQATEFEYNKNRTEGKTGVVKPDLISSKNIQKTLNTKSTDSPDEEVPLKSIILHENESTSPTKVKKNTENDLTAKNEQKECISPTKITRNDKPPMKISPKTSPKNVPQQEITVTVVDSSQIKKVDSGSVVSEVQTSDKSIEKSVKIDEIVPGNIVEDKNNESFDSKVVIEKTHVPIETPKIEKNVPKASETPQKTSTSAPQTTSHTVRPSLKRTKKGGTIEQTKPPNILVYSDSNTTKDNVISTLRSLLEKDVYTIYPLATKDVKNKIWIDNATLLVVCGNVPKDVGKILLDYFLHGGKMFCLCSDVLHIVLPTYRMAEVREHELVQFTYGRWKQVKMMHHIFCYQPSPVKKQFSSVDEDQQQPPKQPMQIPRYVEVSDVQGGQHKLSVKILGTEETWNTPSLMLAQNSNSGGIAVFSQIHLEINPTNYEISDPHYNVLMQNEKYRVEILTDLLKTHLGLMVADEASRKVMSPYTHAYFLGKYEDKVQLLEQLKPKMVENNTLIQSDKFRMKFCGKTDKSDIATENLLPILIHSCPDKFDTVKYFDYLKTEKIGRLMIYSPIMTSSMDVIQNVTLTHGFTVIPRQQTKGSGRGQNAWLSPEGCLMFSLQLHVPLSSVLGSHVSLLQHLVAAAVVKGILELPGYEDLDIRLKWPNDIYANGSTKIGGSIINSVVESSTVICNIGVGINLSNSNPTICLNDLVKEYNMLYGKKLPNLTYEYTLSTIFNQIEDLYNKVQNEGLTSLFESYYKFWLHSEQQVTIVDRQGDEKLAKITGIDDYGFLIVQVEGQHGTETVHPDGNSFDMLRGLILPKF